MNILPIKPYTTFTNEQEKRKKGEAKEVALVAGGATGAAGFTKISQLKKLNTIATDVTKASGRGAKVIGAIHKNAKSFTDKILSGLSTFGKKIGIGGFTADLLMSKTSKKITKGVGGGFAIATSVVGLAETVNAFGGLTKHKADYSA